MAVLVLGADGFIGRAIRAALAPEHRLLSVDVRPVTPLVALCGETPPHGERLLRYDLGSADEIDALWRAVGDELADVDSIVHLAAHYDFTDRDDLRYLRLQRALPTLCDRIAADVPPHAPLLYASSMAGLAPTRPGLPLGADAPRLEPWAYPRYKRAAERILEEADLPQPVVQLVLAGVYSDLCELVPLYQQIERIRRRSAEAVLYPGPTDRGLTYVHVDDVADAFVRALRAFRGEGGVHRLLVGEDAPLTYRAVHHRASRALHGRRLPLVRVPRPVAWLGAALLGLLARARGRRRFLAPWMIRFAGEHFELDTSETQARLGWRPRHRVDEVLDRMLSVARYHPDLWVEVNGRRPW